MVFLPSFPRRREIKVRFPTVTCIDATILVIPTATDTNCATGIDRNENFILFRALFWTATNQLVKTNSSLVKITCIFAPLFLLYFLHLSEITNTLLLYPCSLIAQRIRNRTVPTANISSIYS